MTELTTTPDATKPDILSRPLLATLNLDWEKAIYIAFIVLAIITRFWELGSRVMSHDESLHTQFSYQFYNGDGYNHTPLMHGPFLFHITAVSYWLFGDSDLSARLPVAIFGIVLVAMPYLLRRWIGRVGALFTSFIFLTSPYITYYSRYIRHDIYVIVWAMIVFIASWYYLREQKEKYLWWFAGGTALMFATKEVAFIYVAIFGSFLVIRLAIRVSTTKWFHRKLPGLRASLWVLFAAVLLIGGGLFGQRLVTAEIETAATGEATEGFAANPDETAPAETKTPTSNNETILRWAQIAGIGLLAVGFFLAAEEMRPQIDQYPEFDLIVLFATLILPTVSPLLTTIAGWNPRDYTLNHCILPNQEAMSSIQLLFARMGDSTCWSAYATSGIVRSGFFLVLTLAAAVYAGLWWNRRRWLITAAIFHSIFALLFTSVLTNPGGWASGMVGSLGYWLEQQSVERGSQPTFYYFFVVPFYEFLPLIFSLAAVRLWAQKQKLNKILGYWLTFVLVALLGFSLGAWFFNRAALQMGEETSSLPGAIVGLLILAIGVLYWGFSRRKQLLDEYGLRRNFSDLFDWQSLTGFVPALIWWLLMTWVLYPVAGEKMPWLSTHFVIPMALLTGWFFNEKLNDGNLRALFSQPAAILWGVTMVLIVTVLLAVGPLLLGQIQFGGQELDNLSGIGRFLGSLVVAGGVFYLWRLAYQKTDVTARHPALILGVFGLLSLLTIRFTYMASFPNADYTNEFMVYAHGAPATKNIVLEQIEALSMRLHGDKSIKVAFDNDVSWPFTWYLRQYPNRHYFGENPNPSVTESPVIIVGSLNWDKVEPYLGNDYEQRTYTFLWWPMEEYRRISWNGILGDPAVTDPAQKRGLGNANVRQALWDIFFYRDYEKYSQVFGGTYTAGEWPLRHELRLYIRKDVLANLWDYGIGAVTAEGLQDPYAENEFHVAPIMVLNESGVAGTGMGEFSTPRSVAIGPDGRIYVLDSGNRRIQVFDQEGQFLQTWGSPGFEAGQFNPDPGQEPWGLVVDENYVYVNDTWNHRIQKFTLDGQFVAAFGVNGSPTEEDQGLGLFYGPRDLVLLGDDRLLVTDTGNHRMQILDRDGNFLGQVGNFGNQLGQLNEPVGMSVGPDGSIFLADTWNGRIQQFTADLFPYFEWAVDAWDGQSPVNKPYLATDSAGRIYVTDPEGYRVLIFTPFGDYLGRFGAYGNDANSFALPNGIAIDAGDNVYIADADNNRVLKFAPIFIRAETAVEPGAEDEEIEAENANTAAEDVGAESGGVSEEGQPDTGESNQNTESESSDVTEPSPSPTTAGDG